MSPLWVLVADEAIARVLEQKHPGKALKPVHEEADPTAHAARSELRNDAYGRRSGGDTRMGGNATASASDDEKHQAAALFAKRVAEWMDTALREKRFESLVVVAAPRFLGLLRKSFTPAVSAAVTKELDKDLVHSDAAELTRHLFPAPERNG